VKKTEIPEWLKFTEAKAVVKGDGYDIYFKSLKDATKAYAWAIDSYKQRQKKVDFKKPRRLRNTENDITFVAVDEEKAQVPPKGDDFAHLKEILNDTKMPDDEKIVRIQGWLREQEQSQ
jgi:hypothetical protein